MTFLVACMVGTPTLAATSMYTRRFTKTYILHSPNTSCDAGELSQSAGLSSCQESMLTHPSPPVKMPTATMLFSQ